MAQNPLSGSRRKGPSLRRLIKIDTPRGVLRASKQPYGYKQPKSPDQALMREWFRLAQKAFKHLPAEWQVEYIEATEGTPLMPQDLWMQAFAGRYASIQTTEGTVFWPLMAKQDVSGSLDVLAPQPGDMLARDANGWVGVPGGGAGKVLTSTGPGAPPLWAFQSPTSSWVPVGATSQVGGVIDLKNLDLSGAVAVALIMSAIQTDVDPDDLRLEVYVGGVLKTSGYQFAHQILHTNGSTALRNSDAANNVILTGDNGGSGLLRSINGQSFQGVIDLGSAFVSGLKVYGKYRCCWGTGGTTMIGADGQFGLTTAAAIDGFRLSSVNGNIVSGSVFALKL